MVELFNRDKILIIVKLIVTANQEICHIGISTKREHSSFDGLNGYGYKLLLCRHL